jgi:hypothetical protein
MRVTGLGRSSRGAAPTGRRRPSHRVVLPGGTRFQKVANRTTLGLPLAALIIGAAMLVRVETSFRIMGYPGLAIISFCSRPAWGLRKCLKDE